MVITLEDSFPNSSRLDSLKLMIKTHLQSYDQLYPSQIHAIFHWTWIRNTRLVDEILVACQSPSTRAWVETIFMSQNKSETCRCQAQGFEEWGVNWEPGCCNHVFVSTTCVITRMNNRVKYRQSLCSLCFGDVWPLPTGKINKTKILI